MKMSPSSSADVFKRKYLTSNEIDTHPVISLLQSVFNFYRHERASGLAEFESDMLLFQFGIYDWGAGPFFEIDITRQFIELKRDDDEYVYSQFRLTCRYSPSDEMAAFGGEERWCSDVSELESFAAWVEGHPVLDASGTAPRLQTEIFWGFV